MKIAMVSAAILSATTVGAATTTIENPDHSHIRSTRLQHATATPATNFGNTLTPHNPAKERASIELLIRQLELDMIPKEGETPDQTALRQQASVGIMRKIDKLKSLLLQLPGQSVSLN